MFKYAIFLDDERDFSKFENIFPKNIPVMICRNASQFKDALDNIGVPVFVSFDHDLGQGGSGHDCAKYLIEKVLDTNSDVRFYYNVHSANPVGASNIEHLLNRFIAYYYG